MAAPQRSCRVCRTKRPKAELTRWVSGEGGLVADSAQRLPGRGLYACTGACAAKLGGPSVTTKLINQR